VTVITASYGYLGLAAVIAMTTLILHLFKRPGRMTLQLAIFELNRLNWNVMITGLAFLSVGTFLGGVWANESWGRYWGWDPKETWSLVTILVYAFVAHFRFVESLNRPINLATGSFLAILSVGMTYFGVNYFLSGLHSYAQGDAPGVPGWVYIMAATMLALVMAARTVDSAQRWEVERIIDKSQQK
jgi:ABC-type transport system involved in cytochrome c biogenesis permease subunit